ncbi:hypothetical protein F0L68_38925 [Solihabitans fulvus]|uniref:Excreted virulence factor EspC, type VII ESX diderm n=1 Tax=Solihabitans fulvus TaxID=1892852 RepID=A0A5B2WHJ5_9PSEU|nr:hypothetical protein [Solihabitans fulvus]KAA2250122.1 hypothetical protein F0L68_38925 [Solihabitans fulvus]
MASENALAVTATSLGRTGRNIVDTADGVHRDLRDHTASESPGTGQAFAALRAHADCDAGWQDALTLFGTTIATAGDNVMLSSATYLDVEAANENRFGR